MDIFTKFDNWFNKFFFNHTNFNPTTNSYDANESNYEYDYLGEEKFHISRWLFAKINQLMGDTGVPFDLDKPLTFALNHRLFEDIGMDSLNMVELLMLAEEEFGVKISNEEVVKVKTIEDAIELLFKSTKMKDEND